MRKFGWSSASMLHGNRPKGRWQEYVSPALRIANHPPYQQYAQKEQISAVQRLIDRDPDIDIRSQTFMHDAILMSRRKHPEVYFDMDDIEHVAFLRSIKHPPHWRGKPLRYLQLPVLRLFERTPSDIHTEHLYVLI